VSLWNSARVGRHDSSVMSTDTSTPTSGFKSQ
jgi:hypothetical protein